MVSKQTANSGRRLPPAAGKGRPKGSPNKFTRTAREAFLYAFEAIGGADALAKWGKDNPAEFYRLYGRLIPTEHTIGATDGEPAHFALYVPVKDNAGALLPLDHCPRA